ncbi:3,4-dihydroxy-2-butanone-4-phosphate synthase [Nocardia sp. NPDC051787]|uniref:3,4-dihydroxy-2-butanone-4-phosphate synthase n=1 Tax=Nocardia sp. NPDC051787 TaxID=3155415 RepID=UPI00341362DD
MSTSSGQYANEGLFGEFMRSMCSLDRVRRAHAALAAGESIVLVDDNPAGTEGHLVHAAQFATAGSMAKTIQHTSGFVCVALDGETCDRLDLPRMWNEKRSHTPDYTVTVDAAAGTGTGISAADRAHTAALLAHPESRGIDFTRPGHLVPIRARDTGELDSPGVAEAVVDLLRSAGLRPAGVLGTLIGLGDPTRTASRSELAEFARIHRIPLVDITDIRVSRMHIDYRLERTAHRRIHTEKGDFDTIGYTGRPGDHEHLAIVTADLAPAAAVDIHVASLRSHTATALFDIHDNLSNLDGAVGDTLFVYLEQPAAAPDRQNEVDAVITRTVVAHILDDLDLTSTAGAAGHDAMTEVRDWTSA